MLSNLYTKIRSLIEDISSSGFETFEYTNSNIFTIAQSNITISEVLINGNELESGESYSYSSTTGKITITRASWSTTDEIEVDYTYTSYSDTELKGYIRAALSWISIFSEETNDSTDYEIEDTEIYPTPPNKIQDLICIIASILINPNIMEKRIGNVLVRYPKNKSKNDQIKEIIQMVNMGTGVLDLLEY